MTQEEDLLLKYFCMALPYGVICKCYHTEFDEWDGEPFVAEYNDALESIDVNGTFLVGCFSYEIDEIKPYLRPMSSMTEEEIIEFNNIPSTKNYQIVKRDLPWDVANYKQINWLLEHYFDFMGLIPKGLAIKVTEENNPYKE